MRIKKYLFIILILIILVNITSLNATDNETGELQLNNNEIVEINENTINSYDTTGILSSQNLTHNNPEILKQNQMMKFYRILNLTAHKLQ